MGIWLFYLLVRKAVTSFYRKTRRNGDHVSRGRPERKDGRLDECWILLMFEYVFQSEV